MFHRPPAFLPEARVVVGRVCSSRTPRCIASSAPEPGENFQLFLTHVHGVACGKQTSQEVHADNRRTLSGVPTTDGCSDTRVWLSAWIESAPILLATPLQEIEHGNRTTRDRRV